MNEYIQEKIKEFGEKFPPYSIKRKSLTDGDLKSFIQKSLQDAYNRGVEDSIQTLKNNYGSDGKPALVIIENFEGFNEQRPALEETIDNISKLLNNK